MRIGADSMQSLLSALARLNDQQEKALNQISSGVRITAPSDGPSAMSAWVQNHTRSSENDHFSQSVSSIKALLATGDSVLSSVVTSLQQAISLGVEGATGTLNQSNRDAIAQQITGIRDNILAIANTSFQGTYIFAGTQTQKQPFALDPSSASGVTYAGNSEIMNAEIGDNYTIAMNVPGDKLFTEPGTGVFGALQSLGSALTAGDADAIGQATADLRSAFDHVTSERVFYGNGANQLEAQADFLSSEKVELSSQEDDIAGADQAASITQLMNVTAASQATMAAAAKITSVSLLDYLK